MVLGKTIQIYLPEGNPKGIKICEIPNSIIRAILIPRNEIKKAIETQNLSKVGIYFLFSEKDNVGKFKTYIGEAEDLSSRIKQHDSSEKEWNYAICFISDKNNLNKAHVKFLESYCHRIAKEIGISELINGVSPTKSNLSKSDEDFALTFFDDLKILLGTLGYPILEEIKKATSEEDVFYCRSADSEAKGNPTEEGFVVYAGSKANLEERTSANESLKVLRESLKNNGILKKEGNILIFTEDFVFSSPSTASSIVFGRPSNGWADWKTKEGKTLDAIKRKEIK